MSRVNINVFYKFKVFNSPFILYMSKQINLTNIKVLNIQMNEKLNHVIFSDSMNLTDFTEEPILLKSNENFINLK